MMQKNNQVLKKPRTWYLIVKLDRTPLTMLLYKDVFDRLKERERNYTSLPSESKMNLSKFMCEYLKSFYKLTELFLGI